MNADRCPDCGCLSLRVLMAVATGWLVWCEECGSVLILGDDEIAS